MPKRAPDHITTDLTTLALERCFKAIDDVASLLDHPQDRYELVMNLVVNVVLYAAERDQDLREDEQAPRIDLHRRVMIILANVHKSVEALPRGTDLRKGPIAPMTVALKR